MAGQVEPESDRRGRGRRRWRPWQLVLAAVLAAGLGVFVLVWFQPQKLFLDERVDEDLPEATEPMGDASEPMSDSTEPMSDDMATGSPAATAVPVVSASGEFEDRSHPTSGTARVVELADGSRVLRLEDFATDNGPDLFVYLSSAPPDAAADAFDDDFVDLGVLKGNLGNQNYEIPADVDTSRYSTVVIWCRRFTVAFGVAGLTA